MLLMNMTSVYVYAVQLHALGIIDSPQLEFETDCVRSQTVTFFCVISESQNKQETRLLSISVPYIDRFSQFVLVHLVGN